MATHEEDERPITVARLAKLNRSRARADARAEARRHRVAKSRTHVRRKTN